MTRERGKKQNEKWERGDVGETGSKKFWGKPKKDVVICRLIDR